METQVKTCQNCKKDFTIEPEDFSFYEKINVPPPTFCPGCRSQRRLAWINERNLYYRNCDLCKKRMMSMYHPDSLFTVYCSDCFYGDKWDGIEYGVPFDFTKTFFEQFHELQKRVPLINLEVSHNNKVQSEYANHVFSHSKNLFLSYTMVRCEDCMYSKMGANENKGCLDCYDFTGSERCYELMYSGENYESIYLIDSHSCVHSMFLYDCKNCTNCFMSSHLRNKSYVFKNKQLTREDYLEEISKINIGSFVVFNEAKKEFEIMYSNSFRRYATIINSPSSVGDRIFNCKNVRNSFSVTDSENSKYIIFTAGGARECYDMIYSGKNEQCYELAVCGARNYHAMFSYHVGGSSEIVYSYASRGGSSNLFGCFGLVNKHYCILNKQYTKEQYEELVPEIIKHMNDMPYIDHMGRSYLYGEFFPTELSPFAYNESLAYEEFTMSKDKVVKEGYRWQDMEEKNYSITIESEDLPDDIKKVDDDILSQSIACPNRGKIETKCSFAYRILPEELRFYRLIRIPLPRYCPNCRYYKRRKWKNPWKLWHRKCMKEGCTNEFETSYAPDGLEIVYCEKCYNKEVY